MPLRISAQAFIDKIRDARLRPNEMSWCLEYNNKEPHLQIVMPGPRYEMFVGPDPVLTDEVEYGMFLLELASVLSWTVLSGGNKGLMLNHTPIVEPVAKKIQAQFVQAEHDLMWLAEHGGLEKASNWLKLEREEVEFQRDH